MGTEGSAWDAAPTIHDCTGTDCKCLFTFSRRRAVDAAYRLSLKNPNVTKSTIQVSGTPHSAHFMSLAYYAGGLPMLRNPEWRDDPSDALAGQGWYARLDGKVHGNTVFNNHNSGGVVSGVSGPTTAIAGGRLVQLIAGAPDGTDGMPPADVVDFRYGSFSDDDFRPPGLVVDVSSVLTEDHTRLSLAADLAFLSIQLSGFLPGDYIFVNSLNASDTHGFMIVGYGPAIPCDWDEIAKVTFRNGVISYAGAKDLLLSDFPQIAHLRVPYVVDWTGHFSTEEDKEVAINMQKPRPFYCSTWSNSALWSQISGPGKDRQIDHEWWLFVKAPSWGYVNCDWIYSRNWTLSRSTDGSEALYVRWSGLEDITVVGRDVVWPEKSP